MSDLNITYSATKTASQFHQDNSTIRCLMGPVGSGKSSACVMEILRRSMEQEPAADGFRYSRWVIVRNSYPELKSTTIKDWSDWLPEEYFGKVKFDSPIEQVVQFSDVRLTVWFISLDSERDAKKFRGLRISGVWLNEASELPRIALDMALQRVGRYPDKEYGSPTWSGVIMDTNPPDEDHWIYKLFEEQKPDDAKIFKFEPAMVKSDSGYELNHQADYVKNIRDPNYYQKLIIGQTDDYIRVFVLGLYGTVTAGKQVYPEYNDRLHIVENLRPVEGAPLMLAWDFGLTPACLITQLTPKGQLRVLHEFQAHDSGIKTFAQSIILPFISKHYSQYEFATGTADPAGNARDSIYHELSCIGVLNELSSFHEAFSTVGSYTNAFEPRRNAVGNFLQRLIDGEPAMVISNQCKLIRRGFIGGYHYKRVAISNSGDRYKDTPDKNMYSHLHDCLQYAAMSHLHMKDNSNDNSFLTKILADTPMTAWGGR